MTKNNTIPKQEHRAITGPKQPIKANIKERLLHRRGTSKSGSPKKNVYLA